MEFRHRLYIYSSGKRVLGKGGAQIFEAIDKYGSIASAAQSLGMSYKFVWDYLKRMRRILKKPVVVTRRGGAGHQKKRGGGGAVLTPTARSLLREFRSTERSVSKLLVEKGRILHRSRTQRRVKS